MAKYNLKKKKTNGGESEEVTVSDEENSLSVGALLVCFLLAVLIWLYCTGSDLRRQSVSEEPPTDKQPNGENMPVTESAGWIYPEDMDQVSEENV
jgi:hypothetical protein